ncbi:sensor histidine kinase [Nonomuraea sp. NPDC047897]|uniref:sensor histidine kinase n=1 Tax=Nonomuraea sp. NPDC047897 TaxID=3364346 RepID=UPI00372072A1
MTRTAADTRLDRWERLLERLLAAVPYLLLVVSTALSWLTGDTAWPYRLTTLGLAALTAAWIGVMGRTPGARRHVYVAGLVVLIAVLNTRGIWFASFFAFTGYLHSWWYLPGRWRLAGVTATAAVCIPGYTGRLPEPTLTGILTYLFFVAVVVSLVCLFSFVGDVTTERSAERKLMVARLEETLRENAGLHTQLLVQAREAGVFDERRRMAREIHDTLAQGLAGIIAQLQAATHAHEAGEEPAVWRRHLDTATRLARDSLAEARRSVHAMEPGPLQSAPLPDALARVAAEWSELHGVRADVTATGPVRPLHPEVEGTLLRTAQEALANVAKHARAGRVAVTLSYMEDLVSLDVRDDGAGFDAERVRDGGGYGLTSMRQRVSRLAGTLEIESEPGSGTAISAAVPAVPREHAEESFLA